MALTVAIPLTQEEQAALEAEARVRGVSVDSLVRNAVLQVLSPAPGTGPEMSLEQWEKELDEWLDAQPSLPSLSDGAISRDQIYSREDEWR